MQAAGIMKRVVCCNAGPTLVGSCDPYVCLGEPAGQRRQRGDTQLVQRGGGGQLAAGRGLCQQCALHVCVTTLLQ